MYVRAIKGRSRGNEAADRRILQGNAFFSIFGKGVTAAESLSQLENGIVRPVIYQKLKFLPVDPVGIEFP